MTLQSEYTIVIQTIRLFLQQKWANYEKIFDAFGFKTIRVDGHNVDEIENALKTFSDKPIAVIADTLKGKGFSFMENTLASHYIKIDDEKLKTGLADLEGV